MSSRTDALRAMLEKRPDDARLRFGLAMEYLKEGALAEGVEQLRAYLSSTEDEGNAWGRLGAALKELGREDEARDAYLTGIRQAEAHGHPSMAEEFREVLEDWST